MGLCQYSTSRGLDSAPPTDPVPPVDPQRDFHGRRWLTVVLRSAHLVPVIWLGACLMDGPGAADGRVAHAWVFATGAAMFAVDLWHHPGHLRQWAGMGMLIKLALIAAMAIVPNHALALYWIVVVWSGVVSHAPASFRNAHVIRR
jgi:hypothetical protein